MSNNTIESTELEFLHESDNAGTIYIVTCPECKNQINIAPHSWWYTKCECEYNWSLRLIAEGKRE